MPIIPNLFKEKPGIKEKSGIEVIPDLFKKDKGDPTKIVPDLFPPGFAKRILGKIKPAVEKIIPAIIGKIPLETPPLDKERFKATFGFEPVQDIKPIEKKPPKALPEKVIPDLIEEPAIREPYLKTLRDRIKEIISKPFLRPPEQEVARSQNIYALSKELDLDFKTVTKNYDGLVKTLGMRDQPPTPELLGGLFILPITAGLMAHPLTTIIGMAGFMGLSEIESAVISKAKGEPYKLLQHKGLKDLLPEEVNQYTRDTIEILDFIGKGLILGGIKMKAPKIAAKFTKNILTEYKMPKRVFISARKVSSIFKTGKEISPQELDLIKDLGLSGQQYKNATLKGIAIEIPATKIVTIADKPYFSKIKHLFRLKPYEEVRTFRAGKPVEVIPEGRLLPPPIKIIEPPTVTPPAGKIKGLVKFKNKLQATLGRPLNDMEKETIDTLPEGESAFIEDLVVTHTPETLDTFEVMDKEEFNIMLDGFIEKERTEALKGMDTLYQIIKRHGGIKSYRKGMPGGLEEEYRVNVPIFLRNNSGLPLDEMASILGSQHPEFGIATENDLLKALQQEKTARMNGVRETQGEYIAEKADKLIFGKKPSELVQKTLFGPEEKIPIKAKPPKPIPGQPELPFGAKPKFEVPAAKPEVTALVKLGDTTITRQDLIDAIKQYATAQAGFVKKAGKTLGADRLFREQLGKKLWENMTPEEQFTEFKKFAISDLKIASKEATNLVDYLLDRALDPLDPMAGVYKILLKKAGASVVDKGIKLSPALEAQRTKALEAPKEVPKPEVAPYEKKMEEAMGLIAKAQKRPRLLGNFAKQYVIPKYGKDVAKVDKDGWLKSYSSSLPYHILKILKGQDITTIRTFLQKELQRTNEHPEQFANPDKVRREKGNALTELNEIEGKFPELVKIEVTPAKIAEPKAPAKVGKLESQIELIIKKKGIMYARDMKIETHKDVVDIFYELKNADREKMFILNLDADNKIINVENVSIGTLYASLVHPREVLKNSLLSKAKKLSFIHNHPSENVEASNDDIKILKLLSRVAKKFKIELSEGVIINKTEYGIFNTSGRSYSVPYVAEKPTKEIPLVEIEVRKKPSSLTNLVIKGPEDVAMISKNLMDTKEPTLMALFLNTRKEVNAIYLIGESSKSMDQIANAIIKNGILTNSAAVILSTNMDIKDKTIWVRGIQGLIDKSEAIELLDVVHANLKEPGKYTSLMGLGLMREKEMYIKEPTPEEMRSKDWQVDMQGEPELGKVINKTKIIQWAEKAFKVPIRGKATHRFKAAGMYYPKQALIRLMKWGELEPMMHEIAHHMDRLVMKILGAKWKKELAPLGQRKEVIKELADLDYNKKRRATIEGFAEFIRHYLTTGKAKELAPLFHKFFTDTFLKAHPEFQSKLAKLKEMLEVWQKQGAVNRVLQQVDFKGEHTKIGGWVARFEKAKDWILKNFNNEFHLIKKVEDQMGIKVGVNIRPTHDPFTMATYMKTKSSMIARTFVEAKAIDEYGRVVGKGLEEILKPIARKEMKTWIAYAVAKRVMPLSARGIETGIDIDDAKFIIEKYQKDTWDKVVEEVTEWNRHLRDWIVRAGGLGPEEAKFMDDLNPVYLPFKRAFIDEIMVVKGLGGYVNRGQAIKRIKGSGRAIINPIEAMIRQATEMIAKAHKIKLGRLIAELAKREGIGGIIVKVPAPIQVQKVNLQRVKDIKGFLRDMGLDPDEVDMDQILTAFTQGWQYFGKDNIVSFWENGERVFYEMHPDLYRALSGLDILTLPKVVRVLFSPFARLLRLGATGLKVSFGLARNPFRDAFTHAVFSKRKLAIPVWDTVRGVYKEAVVKTGSLVWRFKRVGGALSGMMGLDRAATMAVYDDFLMNKLGKIGKVLKVCKHPIDSARGLFSFTEMAPRSSEIEAMYKIYQKKHPDWSEEDCFVSAFNDAQDVTVNFTMSGYYAKRINEVAAFFNVAIRGPEKLYRSLRERPFATVIKGIAWITIPSILLWYRNRKKQWYKNLPPSYKYNNFFLDKDIIPSLPDNVIVRLPIPFELGIVFASAPTCALDVLYTKNPKYVDGLVQQIKMQIPDPTPTAFKPWIDVATNKDFLNRPIESEGMQFLYPTERKRHYTTKLAMALSQAFNKLSMPVSPVQIDYMIDSYTGGFARQIPLRPILEPADIPIIGDLLLRMPQRPQRQTNDFFSTYEVLSQKKQSGIASREEIRQLNRMKPVYNHLITYEFKQLKKYHEKRDIESIGKTYEKINRLLKRARFE